MSALLATANPRRIKATHRRRWKCTAAHRVYASNNPYKFTDPDGRVAVLAPFVVPAAIIGAAYLVHRATQTPEQRQTEARVFAHVGNTIVGALKSLVQSNESVTDTGAGSDDGTKTVDELNPVHSPETIGDRPDISGLSDGELLDSVTNPTNGDRVTVNTDTGGVVDGNTRVTELKARAADPNSTIQGDTKIPVDKYTPDKSAFPDLK